MHGLSLTECTPSVNRFWLHVPAYGFSTPLDILSRRLSRGPLEMDQVSRGFFATIGPFYFLFRPSPNWPLFPVSLSLPVSN